MKSEAARDTLTALTHIAHNRIMIIIVGINIPTLLAKSGPWCLTGSSALSAETGLVVHLVNLQSLHSLSLYCHLRNAMPNQYLYLFTPHHTLITENNKRAMFYFLNQSEVIFCFYRKTIIMLTN